MPELVERIIPFITVTLFGLLGFALGAGSASDPYWIVERQLANVSEKVDESTRMAMAVKGASRDEVMALQSPRRVAPQSATPPRSAPAAYAPVGPAKFEFEDIEYKFLFADLNTHTYTWRFQARNVGGYFLNSSARVTLLARDGEALATAYPRVPLKPGEVKTFRGMFVVHKNDGLKVARVTLDNCSTGQCSD